MTTGNQKIVTVKNLQRKLVSHRQQNKKIAFTNGCFDILHYGHIRYLQKAKKKNRILIVGLNSDSSVRKIKGPMRPINNEQRRSGVLAALMAVDYIVIFKEPTPAKIITMLKPDILIKGADWKGKKIAGSESVQKNGGKVEFITYVPGCSTTELIKKIKKTCAR